MAEFLVIRLGVGREDPVGWMAVDSNGTRTGEPGYGALDQAAEQVEDRNVIVLAPSVEVLTLAAEVPAKGARLQAALPFALEDQLAEDIDALHFAPGARNEDGSLPVAVVSHERMADWLQRLREAGIEPNRLVPENHGLAVTPNTLSVLIAENGVMFNDGDRLQFMLGGIGPADAVQACIPDEPDDEEQDDAAKHLLVYCEAEAKEHYEAEIAMLRAELSSVDVRILPDGVLPRLAVTVASGAGINLLQGEYGAKTQVANLLRPWRFTAAVLLALGVVGLLGKGADYYRLSNEQAALKDQFTAEYRQIRPGDSRDIVDPVAVVTSIEQSISGTATGPQVFLPSMQTLADALRQNDAADVEAVSYRAGVATVRLSAPDIPTLDRIVQSIDASGRFTASLQSATNIGDRVQSRITIRETGA
ncbi:MAG: type II secretion system protein GspL [Pseudomonadota bacterium]